MYLNNKLFINKSIFLNKFKLLNYNLNNLLFKLKKFFLFFSFITINYIIKNYLTSFFNLNNIEKLNIIINNNNNISITETCSNKKFNNKSKHKGDLIIWINKYNTIFYETIQLWGKKNRFKLNLIINKIIKKFYINKLNTIIFIIEELGSSFIKLLPNIYIYSKKNKIKILNIYINNNLENLKLYLSLFSFNKINYILILTKYISTNGCYLKLKNILSINKFNYLLFNLNNNNFKLIVFLNICKYLLINKNLTTKFLLSIKVINKKNNIITESSLKIYKNESKLYSYCKGFTPLTFLKLILADFIGSSYKYLDIIYLNIFIKLIKYYLYNINVFKFFEINNKIK